VNVELDRLWTPTPTQASYLDAVYAGGSGDIIIYIGSLGAGKTWVLCRALLGLAVEYPGIHMLLGRFHASELRDTTLKTFFGLVNDVERANQAASPAGTPLKPFGTYHANRNEWTAPRHGEQAPSLIMFRPLEEADRKLKSLNASVVAVDEAAEVPEASMQMLAARAGRQTQTQGYPSLVLLASNPTSRRHWLYKWAVEDPLPGTTLFRTASTENAANLPPNYIERLRKQFSPDQVRRYLEGEWGDLLEGRRPVFPSFKAEIHVGPTKYDQAKPLWIGVDFGWATPGVVWGQMDGTFRLQVLASWLPKELTTHQLAAGVSLRTKEWFPHARTQVFAGHDASQKRAESEGKTNQEIFGLYGLSPKIGFTIKERGLGILRELMEIRDDGTARLIVAPQNETLIGAFQGGYYYPPTTTKDAPDIQQAKPEPVKDGIHDPVVDALRYIVVNTLDLKGDATSPMPWHAFGSRHPSARETQERLTYRRVAVRS
jgi:hypothetical protein